MAPSSYQPLDSRLSSTSPQPPPYEYRQGAGAMVPVTILTPPADPPLFNEHNPFYQQPYTPANTDPVPRFSNSDYSRPTSSASTNRYSYGSTASAQEKRLPKWANKIIHPIDDRREKKRLKEERKRAEEDQRSRDVETFLEPWRVGGVGELRRVDHGSQADETSEVQGVEVQAEEMVEVAHRGVDMKLQ